MRQPARIEAHPRPAHASTTHPTAPRRIAALDGLRGLAVLAVLAFHLDWGWAGGGFLGVSLFFTLSGFLITMLLVDRPVELRRFWSRRARRLLPAAIVVMIAVLVAAPFGAFGDSAGLGGDAGASLAQVANWRFLIDGQSYADLFGDPSPLLHYWSLSIEEQWYVLLPLLVAAIVRAGGGRRALGGALLAITAVSVALPWLFAMDVDRVYYGTDTRIAEITIGGLAAVLLAPRVRLGASWRPARAIRFAAPVALLTMVASWCLIDRTTGALADGALAAHAILAVVVTVAATGDTAVARPLQWAPLVALGRISYALYLVHWPLWQWLDSDMTGLNEPWLSVMRLAVALIAAVTLHLAIETPILDRVRLPTPRRALAALALGSALIVALSIVAPTGSTTIDFDNAAADARPSVLAGATLDEIAASAEAFVGDQATRDFASGSAQSQPAMPRNLEEPDGLAAAPVVDLRPTGKLSLGQALDIVGAIGTGFYEEPSADGPELATLAFDVSSDAPRVVVFGDSAALMLGFGLTDWARATGRAQVLDLGVVGCGLVRGGLRLEPGGAVNVGENCGDWEPAFVSLAELLEPDVVMLHYGLWETVDRLVRGWDDWQTIGDPDFDRLLEDEILAATRVFTSRGIAVGWVNSPPLEPRNLPDSADPRRVQRLNEVLAATVSDEPGAMLVDLHRWFANRPDGPMDRALRPDGVHVSYEGSDVVAWWLGPRLLRARAASG